MYVGPKKVFEADSNPKNSPKGPKRPQKREKAPNLAELKTKR